MWLIFLIGLQKSQVQRAVRDRGSPACLACARHSRRALTVALA